MNRLLISAAHKSSGKTTLSVGLCAALHRRGLKVQPFKKGPDYIDPMWLSLAAERPCHNLDFFIMGHDEILGTVATRAADADIALIEGNKGLYDGLDLDGSNSNAALARLLDAPVVLVIDARGMTRGVAPLILGYQAFDREIRIGGVILNQLGGARHERKLRAVIEHYTDVPVIGAVHHDDRLAIVERHLGLVPSNEASGARAKIDALAEAVAAQVDLDRLLMLATTVHPLPVHTAKADSDRGAWIPASTASGRRDSNAKPVRIGVARDAAFAFYYPADLEALQRQGAELVAIDTLTDRHLPAVDGLFIGGGFPEVHMRALEANESLRSDIRHAIDAGLPVYAECGGLMYLSRSLSWHGERCAMVGALPADTVMHDRPQGRGYVKLRETGMSPWPTPAGAAGPDVEIRAHEFHYSSLENVAGDLAYAYEVKRGTGIDGERDGIVYRNVLACYTHMRDVGDNHWTTRFVEFVRRVRSQKIPTQASG
jgi:cobyrinic acid a,c-diamide synthase